MMENPKTKMTKTNHPPEGLSPATTYPLRQRAEVAATANIIEAADPAVTMAKTEIEIVTVIVIATEKTGIVTANAPAATAISMKHQTPKPKNPLATNPAATNVITNIMTLSPNPVTEPKPTETPAVEP